MQRVAIIGGGAAGLSCACELGYLLRKSGKTAEITLFEENARVGKKLLATGNGRCNLSNLSAVPAAYPVSQRAFVTPALTAFGPESTLRFFERLSLYCRTDEAGRVYPLSNQAAGVLDALRLEAARLGVNTVCGTSVTQLEPEKDGFLIGGERFDVAVLCCGGKAGAKNAGGYRLLRQLSIPVTALQPGLVRLKTESAIAKQLKGIRVAAKLTLWLDSTIAAEETGELLFGDGVLSGIAAMNLSSRYAHAEPAQKERAAVTVDFVPTFSLDALEKAVYAICRSGQRETNADLLSGFVPKAISVLLCRLGALAYDDAPKDLTELEEFYLCKTAKEVIFPISGTASFSDAQVTVGGADRAFFDANTLESKQYKNLYCCGELLDVDGPCGGYNLQWAFASARLCAKSIVEKMA